MVGEESPGKGGERLVYLKIHGKRSCHDGVASSEFQFTFEPFICGYVLPKFFELIRLYLELNVPTLLGILRALVINNATMLQLIYNLVCHMHLPWPTALLNA